MTSINNDISNLEDPSYYDPTNPASPYYDPSLVQITTGGNPITAVVTQEAKAETGDKNDAVTNPKRGRRHLRTLEQQNPTFVNANLPITVDSKLKKNGAWERPDRFKRTAP